MLVQADERILSTLYFRLDTGVSFNQIHSSLPPRDHFGTVTDLCTSVH